jgi:glycosyltransferase involved in cell wall biosynthesis
MRKIFGLTVIRNEEHRYLSDFIFHHQYIFDDIFVFDDNSTDRTREICAYNGLTVAEADGVSFLEHEGKFRYQAWQKFEEKMKPSVNDWIFVIDADEFLVADNDNVKSTVQSTIDLAEYFNHIVVRFHKNEVWDFKNSECLIRVDGFWGKIDVPNLFRYQKGGTWNMKAMACGSGPTYTKTQPFKTKNFNLLHFGYATEEDRKIKYDRYANAPLGQHNRSHIMSIISQPKLETHTGPVPWWVSRV